MKQLGNFHVPGPVDLPGPDSPSWREAGQAGSLPGAGSPHEERLLLVEVKEAEYGIFQEGPQTTCLSHC